MAILRQHGRGTQHNNTFCPGPKRIAHLCVTLCSVSPWCGASSPCLMLSSLVFVCIRVHKLAWLPRCSPPFLTADRAMISLVWSSQMEPEYDLFPGETVCFLCPACTKSHIVPLHISHTDSPLQVLGYLADRGSDFRSFFIFLTNSQNYTVYPSPSTFSAQSKYSTTH